MNHNLILLIQTKRQEPGLVNILLADQSMNQSKASMKRSISTRTAANHELKRPVEHQRTRNTLNRSYLQENRPLPSTSTSISSWKSTKTLVYFSSNHYIVKTLMFLFAIIMLNNWEIKLLIKNNVSKEIHLIDDKFATIDQHRLNPRFNLVRSGNAHLSTLSI